MTILERINWWHFNVKVFLAKWLMKTFGYVPWFLRTEFAKNPLLKYPRNIKCWCGSHKKAKFCCLPQQAKVCRVENVKFLTQYMKAVEIHNAKDQEPMTESGIIL